MPLVKPKEKETQDNFISRCMSDPKSKEEFPNQSQRLAVCNSLFEGGKSMDEKYHKKPKDKEKEKDKRKARVGKDEYDNPGEAAARAKEIGCSGIHTHDTPDGKIFMPCKTHSDYMNALAKDKDDEKYGSMRKKPKDKKEEEKDCECDSGNEKCQCDYSDYDELNDKDWVDQSIADKGQRQVYECEIKTEGEAEGEFEGYASTFGNVDKGNDVVVNGAFRKSLRRRPYNKVKLLYQHRTDEPIGVFKGMREDDNGLYVKGQLAMGTQKGREVYELMKMGALDAMSIGFKADPKSQSYDERRRKRFLRDVDLMEVSLVTFPMNDKAVVHQVKGADRTIREWEVLLRDVGDLSRMESKVAAKAVVDALEQREVAEDFGDVLESIEKVKKVLTTNN
tara:strand:- start:1659 stop:2837 length:1179 start_codon:yes stop_codon:yes gene_type:complete